MNNRLPEFIAYVVKDTPFNRRWYPHLVGKGFAAPPGYAQVLPYRRIQTEGIEHPAGYTPPQPIDSTNKENT